MVVIAHWWLVSGDAREAERSRDTSRALPVVGRCGELRVATTGPLRDTDFLPALLGVSAL